MSAPLKTKIKVIISMVGLFLKEIRALITRKRKWS